uniref:Secretin receptor n=1 Tax=Neolamprologus brichardi TaxID=32507 RepID=A0A3Q4HBF7_NEOBR
YNRLSNKYSLHSFGCNMLAATETGDDKSHILHIFHCRSPLMIHIIITVLFYVHCKGMWDDLNCWPPAFLGETVSQPCPDVILLLFTGKVHRNCTNNGWTDLLIPHEDACGYSFNESLLFLGEVDSHLYFSYVKTMYTVGYTISLISLIIAITIFCVFRKLHCTRNYIHIQLFISFSLRAIFIFIRDALLFTDEEIYHCDYYPAPCKVVLMFSNYSILANYSWLLVEGHFLYTLVNRSFFSLKKHLAWYIVLSWGGKNRLYLVKSLIVSSPIWRTTLTQSLLEKGLEMNLIFFMGILRILVSKLRMPDAQRNELSQYNFLMCVLFGFPTAWNYQKWRGHSLTYETGKDRRVIPLFQQSNCILNTTFLNSNCNGIQLLIFSILNT